MMESTWLIGTLQRMAHIHPTLLQTVMILNGIVGLSEVFPDGCGTH
jgi:hypothetical protein